jgi:hypothetical protein
MSRCSLEKVHKRDNESPLSKYRGFGVFSMKKNKGRRKMFIPRANTASLLSNCSSPSQPPLLKPLLWVEIAL